MADQTKPKAIDGIHQALIEAQRAMGPLLKDKSANYGKYATLGAVIETITDPLHNAGIVWFQPLEVLQNGEVVLVTTLVHAETGGEIVSRYPVRCKDHQDPQKVGGAVTYARRYALMALLGLAPEDDDGQLASQPSKTRQGAPQGARTGNEPTDGKGKSVEATAPNNGKSMDPTEFWTWTRARGFKNRGHLEEVLPETKGVTDLPVLRQMIEDFLVEANGED